MSTSTLALPLVLILALAPGAAPASGALPEGTRETAQAPEGGPAQAPPAAGAPAGNDPRPVVRISVTSSIKKGDRVFPQVVEGRLVSDLADMETFRSVGPDQPGDYLMAVSILALDLEQGGSYDNPRDAESNGQLIMKDTLNARMTLSFVVEDGAGRKVLEQKLSVDASREMEGSAEHTVDSMSQELIDRAAVKIERLLRKKLPRPR